MPRRRRRLLRSERPAEGAAALSDYMAGFQQSVPDPLLTADDQILVRVDMVPIDPGSESPDFRGAGALAASRPVPMRTTGRSARRVRAWRDCSACAPSAAILWSAASDGPASPATRGAAVGRTGVVPFLLQDQLTARRAQRGGRALCRRRGLRRVCRDRWPAGDRPESGLFQACRRKGPGPSRAELIVRVEKAVCGDLPLTHVGIPSASRRRNGMTARQAPAATFRRPRSGSPDCITSTSDSTVRR